MFPYHASHDCRVRWEHGSRIKCSSSRTCDRRRGTLLRSRLANSLDALSIIDGRWLSSPCRFARPCFRNRGYGRHYVLVGTAALVILHLCRYIKPELRIVCGSFHCECWLGYPILTSSIVGLAGMRKEHHHHHHHHPLRTRRKYSLHSFWEASGTWNRCSKTWKLPYATSPTTPVAVIARAVAK